MADYPDEVVHRHRSIVRVAADEMFMPPRLPGGITQREEFVFVRHCQSIPLAGRKSAITRLVNRSIDDRQASRAMSPNAKRQST